MREFPSDAGKPTYLPYSTIMMPTASLTLQPGLTTAAACQDACSASARCTYLVTIDDAGNGTSQCFFRLAAADVAAMAGFNPANSTLAVLFEVREGLYAAYPALSAADAAGVGITLAAGQTWDAARAACAGSAACVGMALGATPNSWRLFSGSAQPYASGKVRVFGATLNSWVPDGGAA